MTIPATPTEAVSAVMHRGVINIPPQASLQEAAAEMAEYRVHCVVVEGLAKGRDRQETLVWGILSDLDVMKAIASERFDAQAGDLAATEIITVEESESVMHAAQLMAEYDTTHLVVIAPSGAPAGVVSSLDVVARAATWPESAGGV